MGYMMSKNQLLYLDILAFLVCKLVPAVIAYTNAYIELVFILVGFFLMFPLKKSTGAVIIKGCGLIGILLIIEMCFLRIASYKSDYIYALYHVVDCLFALSIPIYYLEEQEDYRLSKMVYVILVLYTFTQITSIAALSLFPEVSRNMITGMMTNSEMHAIEKYNIAGYAFAYMVPTVTFSSFYLYKKNLIGLWFVIVHIALSLVFLITVQFTMALLLYVISVLIAAIAKCRIKYTIPLVIIAIITIVIVKDPLGNLFLHLGTSYFEGSLGNRIISLGNMLKGSDADIGDIGTRFLVYGKSLNSFIGSPLIGGFLNNEVIIGGHSTILDFLAKYGIIGVLFGVVSFKKYYNVIFSYFSFDAEFGYVIFSQILFWVYAFLNPAFGTVQFMILSILPVGILCKSRIMESDVYENNVGM